jgi:hypothetical protein
MDAAERELGDCFATIASAARRAESVRPAIRAKRVSLGGSPSTLPRRKRVSSSASASDAIMAVLDGAIVRTD